MDKETFKELLGLIAREFSYIHGVLVQCRTVYKDKNRISMCVSVVRNTGLVPTDCIVWDQAKLLYAGKLNDYALRRVLTKQCVCCMEFTNTMDLDAGRPGWQKCMGDRAGCPKTCLLKTADDGVIYNPTSCKAAKALTSGAKQRKSAGVETVFPVPWWQQENIEETSDAAD